MNVRIKWAGLVLAAVAVAGCAPPETAKQPEIKRIYTTFYPTTWFTQRIAGDRAKVVCPIPADEDPIFWMPDGETIRAYQEADLIVINGAGFEKWVDKISLPPSKVVDTAKPLEKDFLKFTGSIEHSHGTSEKHSHEGIDGHTWLDPNHARVQANEIRRALAALLPEHAEEFARNYAALAGELDELDRSFQEFSGKLQGRHLLASRPAYNYLAKRYGWTLTNLDLDPKVMPDDEKIAEIGGLLGEDSPRIVLWEVRPARVIAERLAQEFDLRSVEFSPCELLGEAEDNGAVDYLSVMRANIERLRVALEQ